MYSQHNIFRALPPKSKIYAEGYLRAHVTFTVGAVSITKILKKARELKHEYLLLKAR
jgi:hypothetical protein